MGWATFPLFLVLSACINGQYTREQIMQGTMKLRKLPNDVCGESSEFVFEKKIINGEPAELGAYPWMAAIGYTLNDQGPYWNCGGSVITDQYVLTAAHCLDPKRITARRPFKVSAVRVGDLNLDSSVSDGASPIDVDVEKIVFHPNYDNNLKINDIGLIKMKRKITFTDSLKPICLPPAEFQRNDFKTSFAIVAGWGRTGFGEDSGPVAHLLEAEVEIQDLDACRRNITSVLPRSVIDDKVVCASAPGKDSCQGDSGGPLMLFRRYNGRAKMYLLGVVSYGYSCALEGYPGVYTRVARHMQWIIDNLEI